jgi:hypothetical protein
MDFIVVVGQCPRYKLSRWRAEGAVFSVFSALNQSGS